jgi:uncharacterized protein YaaQ
MSKSIVINVTNNLRSKGLAFFELFLHIYGKDLMKFISKNLIDCLHSTLNEILHYPPHTKVFNIQAPSKSSLFYLCPNYGTIIIGTPPCIVEPSIIGGKMIEPASSPSSKSADKPPADTKPLLMIAVVQAQDADISFETLKSLGVSCERLSSVGGFLGRKNVTLLISLPVEKQSVVMAALQENCRQRVEYIAVPLESAPLPLPTPTPITVGGATIFSLDIDQYEEF